MTYFEAQSIYQDIAVKIQFAGISGRKDKEELIDEWRKKYGFEKIGEAIVELCNELDQKRNHYLGLLKLVKMLEDNE
jgi:hypothetical protein